MKGMENKLNRPVYIHDTSEKEYKKKKKEYQVGKKEENTCASRERIETLELGRFLIALKASN